MLLLITVESIVENPFFEVKEAVRLSSIVSVILAILMAESFAGPGLIEVKRKAAAVIVRCGFGSELFSIFISQARTMVQLLG